MDLTGDIFGRVFLNDGRRRQKPRSAVHYAERCSKVRSGMGAPILLVNERWKKRSGWYIVERSWEEAVMFEEDGVEMVYDKRVKT